MSDQVFKTGIARQGRIAYRSESRGYSIDWAPDLIGWTTIRRRWFGLENKRGGSKMHVVPTLEDARRLMRDLHAKRLRHGYEVHQENEWLKSRAQKAALLACENAALDLLPPPTATERGTEERLGGTCTTFSFQASNLDPGG